MTTKEILQYVKGHPSGKVKIAVTDIDGILRGKYISTEKFLSVLNGRIGFCDVVFGWDMNDAAYDNVKFTGWHTGYPDAPAKIDINTFRKIPWENDLPFFLADFITEENEPLYVCPRQLLNRIKNECLDSGYIPYFSQEFEWFNFSETPFSLHQKGFRNMTALSPGMFGYSILRSTFRNDFMSDLFDLLNKFDITIEGLHTETGPGVYEAALLYTQITEAADRATLFKTAVKEVAYKHNIIATFMAKWNENLPGCSGHVHQSLWDNKYEKNLFYDKADAFKMSALLKSYVAGQLYCLPHVLPMYAPTINSFKRLVEGAWAPTTLTWGIDNRTVALRILNGSKKSARLETRVVGSDVNPYLAMAACLASGLYGIKHKLELGQPPTTGNGYQDLRHGVLPANLEIATKKMRDSTLAKELFGEKFVDHFTLTREWEWRQYEKEVPDTASKTITDWELKRYFEII